MEIWKESNTHHGLMISSNGRVRLPVVQSTLPNGGIRIHKTSPTFGHKSRSRKGASHEYMSVRNRRLGTMKVHQLVCSTFHGKKPTPNSVVIHIDEDGCNNHATNLRWGTQKENMNMLKYIAYCKSRTGANSPSAKGKLNKLKS